MKKIAVLAFGIASGIAIGACNAQTITGSHENRTHLLFILFQQDPNAAFPEIKELVDQGIAGSILTDLYASHLAKTNPKAAFQWAMSQGDLMPGENAVLKIFNDFESVDPDTMIQFIDQLSESDRVSLLPELYPIIVDKMALNHPWKALNWARQLSEPHLRAGAEKRAIYQWAKYDSKAVTLWLMDQANTTGNRSLIRNIIQPLIIENPDAAKHIIQYLPSDVQLDLTEPLLMSLLKRNTHAPRQWLEEQRNQDVQAIGSIILDSMDPDADTFALLDRLGSLQSGRMDHLFYHPIERRLATHREEVELWFSSTKLLSPYLRKAFKPLIKPDR